MSYIVKRKVRKYRKKFVIPVLTSNGTMGGDSFAVDCSTPKDNVYEIFNAGADGTKAVDTNPNAAPQWVRFYNPVPLKVTKFRLGQIKNTAEQNNYYITAWKVQASDDKETWVDVWSGTATKPAQTLVADIKNSGYHKYYRAYVVSAQYYPGYPRVFFCGIDFNAEAEDAVFYDEVIESYAAKLKIRRYYKYISQPWEQPTLTADGTIGGDSFAVSASNYQGAAFNAINDNNSSWVGGRGYPIPYVFYNPKLLDITKLDIGLYGDSMAFDAYELQISEDGNTYKTIYSGNSGIVINGAYQTFLINLSDIEERISKYWRINLLTPKNNGGLAGGITRLKITANAYSAVQEVSSADEWDYSEEIIESYVIGRKYNVNS